jgi:hypothetical protein
MSTLTVDTPRAYVLGDLNDIPMIANDIIYEGAAVGIVVGTGHARPLVAGDYFAGFAQTKCDNTGGDAAAKNVRVIRKGRAYLAVTSVAITDIGALVFASDDDTFVLTSSPAESRIGKVTRYISSGYAEVAFEAHHYAS